MQPGDLDSQLLTELWVCTCTHDDLYLMTWTSNGLYVALHAGADLDPLRVLEALPAEVPLGAAYATVAALLRERTHRRRHCSIVRQLRRAESLAVSADRAEVRPASDPVLDFLGQCQRGKDLPL